MKTTLRVAGIAAAAAMTATPAYASCFSSPGHRGHDHDGDRLLLSRTVYTGTPSLVTPGVTKLPAGCTTSCVTAIADGGYPEVFNNEKVDESFGVSSPILLDELTTSGRTLDTLRVPAPGSGHGRQGDGLVTSFPSKSELALNVSTGGDAVSFMGYVAPDRTIDVSNSNTPGVVDPTNPVGTAFYRGVALLGQGRMKVTETNAYSGNNGRAAILDSADDVFYAAGNAGNGGNPQPAGVVAGAGAQLITPSYAPERVQAPGAPTPLGSFSITQLGDKADKVGKDTNFRGLTVFDDVVYLTKGSGGNGVNTVYFVDTTGTACPNGVGLPVPGAKLPTNPLAYDPATVAKTGVTPPNMCILKGFPTALKSTTSFPFGLWFANDHTLYVADEGNADTTYDPATGRYTAASAQTTAGLQKWVLANGTWSPAYTISAGLGLGTPYTVAGYPTGTNPVTGLPWAPATDGLRNITGRTNPDGSVTIWGITSTVSGATDVGADPNRLVTVTDRPEAATSNAAFSLVRTARSGEALRGVAVAPRRLADRVVDGD